MCSRTSTCLLRRVVLKCQREDCHPRHSDLLQRPQVKSVLRATQQPKRPQALQGEQGQGAGPSAHAGPQKPRNRVRPKTPRPSVRDFVNLDGEEQEVRLPGCNNPDPQGDNGSSPEAGQRGQGGSEGSDRTVWTPQQEMKFRKICDEQYQRYAAAAGEGATLESESGKPRGRATAGQVVHMSKAKKDGGGGRPYGCRRTCQDNNSGTGAEQAYIAGAVLQGYQDSARYDRRV